LSISVTCAEDASVVYIGERVVVEALEDPLEIVQAMLGLTECSLDKPGLYWLDVWYDGVMITELWFTLEDDA
jgi:hypothetical protein